MPHRIATVIHICQVLIAHALAIVITLTDVSDWLKIVSLLLAIGYTAWRWITDVKNLKKKK